jgi:hypothetical protein
MSLAELRAVPHVCSQLEQLRRRYAQDEEFRRAKIAYAIAYQQAHKDQIRERRRRRRESDPAYRERLLAENRAYREAHKEELSGRRKLRRQTDPAYREKLLASERESRGRYSATRRAYRLRSNYGISLEEYDAMLARQGGVCAICKKPPAKGKRLVVDHCHLTGMVRGLLCGKCNSLLAFGNDDPDIMRAAIAYLRAARKRYRSRAGPRTLGAGVVVGKSASRPRRTRNADF